ncbi:MAG: 3-isopropylmalate dehydrogenase [Candidatus Omnitrophica bacterium]|nr:3-isopropylmalate dehydrogenase [Candidatus Omnitrophota bacterium]
MYKITVLPGDGIGPEVTEQALKVIQKLAKTFHLVFEIEEAIVGGCSIDKFGMPLTAETLQKAMKADAVFLGAVGGPKWDHVETSKRPEKALLALRKSLEVYANIRPAKMFPGLINKSTLKPEVVKDVDFVIFRELVGGIYFGEPRGISVLPNGEEQGINTEVYSTHEVERIARRAFDFARRRRRKVTSVDKANVLESSQLWRRVVTKVHAQYPDVHLDHRYVDDCAMQLIKNPKQFDVIVTTNLFGDILSDESAMVTGSIGMLASASIGDKHALYEPVHGSAPDIAGQDLANPLAAILSVAMMMEYSFNLHELAQTIEKAVSAVITEGYRTPDLYEEGTTKVGCVKMGDLVAERIRA